MAIAVAMPRLGNTVESSIIVRWRKQKGDTVSEGETLCEVETDKATMEVPSPASGTLLDVFFNEGDDVPVMTTIAAIGAPGESAESLRPGTASAASVPSSAAPAGPAQQSAVTAATTPVVQKDSFVGISPRARNLANRKGLVVDGLPGTGPGGRIIERDVQAALDARPRMTPLAQSMLAKGDFVAPPRGSGVGGRITSKDLQPADQPALGAEPVTPVVAGETERIPVKGVRKIIAERMLDSMQTTAQLTLNASADARALLDYRKRLKNSPEELGLQKVTINDLVLLAVSRTVINFRDLNALFEGDSIIQYRDVHLGFAVDTPRGLIVPVIHYANRLALRQIAQESARLAAACQDGKVSPDELAGGTFTVTNLGSLGIESFTPILNPPQVGILGVSSIQLKPVEVEGDVQFIPHLGLSLTINHQVVDGAPAARFLQALSRNLAQFDLLLAV